MAESTAERATAGFPWSTEGQALEAASVLAPEQGVLADIDPALFGQAMATAALRAVRDPVGGTRLGLRLAADLVSAGFAAWDRLLGGSASGPVTLDPKDRRFADPAWQDNPAFFAVRQAHLAWREYVLGLLTRSNPDPVTDGKARLALSVMADALAPTNFLPTNPAALKADAGSPLPISSDHSSRNRRGLPGKDYADGRGCAEHTGRGSPLGPGIHRSAARDHREA